MMPSPPAAWPRHDGVPGPPDADYLVAPDAAIGAVLSAETNYSLARSFYAMDLSRQGLVVQVVAVCLALGWLGSVFAQAGSLAHVWPWSSGLGLGQKGIALGCALLAAVLGALVTRAVRRRRSSYVGRSGVQVRTETCLGVGRTELARFADCAALRVMQTRHHLNGAYMHTSFKYAFFDRRDRPALLIKGQFDDRAPRRSYELLRFALAAEQAWNDWKRASALKSRARGA